MAPWVPMFTQSCKNAKQAFIPFQFATVAESVDGIPLPKCRTVVFRDFLFDERKTNVLTFNTDLRSNKVEESFPNGNGTCLFEACFISTRHGNNIGLLANASWCQGNSRQLCQMRLCFDTV